MKNYKEPGVWQKSVELSITVYRVTGRFPEPEKFGLTSQLRRAATSIPANIAEGWGRGSTREYVQLLLIARGSLMELETHGVVAQQLGYLSKEQFASLEGGVEEIGKMLNGLIQALKAKSRG